MRRDSIHPGHFVPRVLSSPIQTADANQFICAAVAGLFLGDPRGSNCAPPMEATLDLKAPCARTEPSSRLSVLELVTPCVVLTRYVFPYCSLVVSRRAAAAMLRQTCMYTNRIIKDV